MGELRSISFGAARFPPLEREGDERGRDTATGLSVQRFFVSLVRRVVKKIESSSQPVRPLGLAAFVLSLVVVVYVKTFVWFGLGFFLCAAGYHDRHAALIAIVTIVTIAAIIAAITAAIIAAIAIGVSLLGDSVPALE